MLDFYKDRRLMLVDNNYILLNIKTYFLYNFVTYFLVIVRRSHKLQQKLLNQFIENRNLTSGLISSKKERFPEKFLRIVFLFTGWPVNHVKCIQPLLNKQNAIRKTACMVNW